MAKIKAIRGMNDILPQDTPLWLYLEDAVRQMVTSYGYSQIRMPVVELTELFKRSIGEVTDIVEKEMYSFDDRNGESLTLRPEGTAGCVRAGEENGLFFNQQQKLWYMGPMFRYERPQKGRYRQFHQIGVEAFGMQGPDIDAELILMTARLWRQLGLANNVRLELNSLGSAHARALYRDELVVYLRSVEQDLDEDSRRRLDSNPLRILDSKNPQTQELLNGAPVFADFMDTESKIHFDQLQSILQSAGVDYQLNPRLVRGLDYYGKTVFEWVTSDLGAQGTVCAGGRYDGLVEQLGGRAMPAVGFALGVERLILMLQTLQCAPAGLNITADIYVVAGGQDAEALALSMAEEIRDAMPQQRIQVNCGGGSFKSQLKRADKSGAQYALIIGDAEIQSAQVVLKPLRGDGDQQKIARNILIEHLQTLMSAER